MTGLRPTPGQINFGGGVAERYLGDGQWRIFREDERYCPLSRHGRVHEPHNYAYVYERSQETGGFTSGSVPCDGLARDEEPWPSIAHEFAPARDVAPLLAQVAGVTEQLAAEKQRAFENAQIAGSAVEAVALYKAAIAESLKHTEACPVCKASSEECCSQFCSRGCGLRADYRYVHVAAAALVVPTSNDQRSGLDDPSDAPTPVDDQQDEPPKRLMVDGVYVTPAHGFTAVPGRPKILDRDTTQPDEQRRTKGDPPQSCTCPGVKFYGHRVGCTERPGPSSGVGQQ